MTYKNCYSNGPFDECLNEEANMKFTELRAFHGASSLEYIAEPMTEA